MPALTLYRVDGACSIAAHMLLRELQLPFTEVILQRNSDGVYAGPEGSDLTRGLWLKISPTGYVPALTVDGQTMTEMSAVLFYIASLTPDRGLTGNTPFETAKVIEWTSWLGTAIQEYGFAGRWAPTRMVGMEASEEALNAVREHGKKELLSGFAMIESRVQCDGHAVEGHLTVVDFMLHTFFRWGVLSGFDMQQYPKFKAVVLEVEKLQGVRDALKTEGIELQFP